MKKLLFLLLGVILMTQLSPLRVSAMTDKEFNCEDDTLLYSVDNIKTNEDLENLGCFKTYQEAIDFFNTIKTEKPDAVVRFKNHTAPNKIIVMNTGYAIATATSTVDIYRNPDFTSSVSDYTSYIESMSKMVYLETVINSKNQIVYKVEISGYLGYVSSGSADLVPSLYVENDYPFEIRNGSSTLKLSKMDANYYQVISNGSYNELYLKMGKANTSLFTVGPIAIAPSWMPVGYYYSANGINFYSDFRMTKPVNNGAPFYNYFQFLPLRTRSNITGAQMDKFLQNRGLTNSVYYGKSNDFVTSQNKYGMNGLLVFAMAGLESAFGTSYYAKNRNNLFGWNAVDSNPDQADAFYSVSHAIQEHMGINLFGYTNVADWRFTSPALGNKISGFNTKYASDPFWGVKIAAIAYQVDKENGFKDLNYYGLGILGDKLNVNVYKSATFNSAILYNTQGHTKQLIHQPIAITRQSGEFYESTTWYPLINGALLTTHKNGDYINHIDKSLGYIHNSVVTLLNPSKWAYKEIGELPAPIVKPEPKPEPEIVLGESGEFKVIASGGLNLREKPTTSSNTFGLVPFNTVLAGTYVNNKTWVQVTYNGKLGYLAAEYVELVKLTPPAEVKKTYEVTAQPTLNVRSEPNTNSTILGSLAYKAKIEGTLVENGAWLKINYNGKTGYVSSTYVKEVVEPNNPPVTKPQIDVGQTLGYTNVSGTLTGMNLTTTIDSIIAKLKAVDSSITVSVVNSSGTTKASTSNLSTGDKVTITQTGQSNQVFNIAVKGDLNGDGKINSSDYVSVANHLLKKGTLSAVSQIAADVTGDGRVNSSDYVRLANHLLRKNPLH